MSETDDTDDLLLIPPDFFVIDSELESGQTELPYYKVFDSIISQVNKLEKRLDYIESSSDLSIGNSSLVHSFSDNTVSDLMYKSEDHAQKTSDSAQSTPQKPRTKFKLNSLPSSPNTGTYSPRSRINLFSPKNPSDKIQDLHIRQHVNRNNITEKQKASAMLGEIGHFITNVKTIQRINTSKNIDEPSSSNMKRLGAGDVNRLIDRLESQEKQTEKRSTWDCGDNINTVPDYGTGMRQNMYNKQPTNLNSPEKPFQKSAATKLTSANKEVPSEASLQTPSDQYIDERSLSSTDSTQTTALYNLKYPNRPVDRLDHSPPSEIIHSNALRAIDLHNKLLNRSISPSFQDAGFDRSPKKYSQHYDSSGEPECVPLRNLKLLSLRDLWSQKESSSDVVEATSCLSVKLEEEKLRRQHCEHLIKQLQARILELQERLAVALEVDGAKDEAILRFHNAWENVATKLKSLSTEKIRIEEDIDKIKTENQRDLEEAAEKVAHYEKEASKALALAHNNHEKLATLEKQYNEFQNQNKILENRLLQLQRNYDIEVDKNRQFSEIIAHKEVELNENKNVLATARKEVAQSKKAVEVCQTEFTTLKIECNQLRLQLNEERQKVIDNEEQKKKLGADINTHKKNEKNLQEEITKLKEQMDQSKTELRNFYQDQVETVVREKLREFQTQLERAENALQDELKKKELSIAKTAAMHIQKISEKHNLEVQLLEEKHREEVRLYQIQLSQNEQQIQSLHARLQKQDDRRTQLAQQLHKVMEAQWLEALKIINNTKSPIMSNTNDFSTIDQLNSLRSQSHTNLEKLLSLNLKGEGGGDNKEDGKSHGFPQQNTNSGDLLGSTSSVIEDDGRGHARHFAAYSETPVSSKDQRGKKQNESELQKYIQLLLNKSPGDSHEQKEVQKNPESLTDERTLWHNENQEDPRNSKGYTRERKFGKPPWK